MTFANPWGLLALLGIPVVVYFHRRTATERRMVPLVRLWQPGSSTAAQGARRRIDLMLLLRLALVAGVALALARPGWPIPAPGRQVLLVDASASMGARVEGGTRFARAIEAAVRLLEGLPPQAEAMLLRGGSPPTVVHDFSRDRAALRTALSGMHVGAALKDLPAGLALAGWALRAGHGVVHVFSDASDPKSVARLGERVGLPERDLRVHPVGGRADNVAVVRLESAPLPSSPLDYAVLAVIGNFTRDAHAVDVSLVLPEGVRERRRVSLAAGERQPISFTVPAVPWVEVRLEGNEDALPIDDRATLALPVAPLRVLYASRDDRFLDAAVRAHPGLLVEQVPAAELAATGWSGGNPDVAILDGAVPPPGFPAPALSFAALDSSDGRRAHTVPLVEWQREHPFLRQLDLAGAVVPAGAVLSGESTDLLLRSADGPVARATVVEGLRRVEFAFPADHSNIGSMPAFPVLVARALDWLADGQASADLNLRVGQPLRFPVPNSGAGAVTVRRPDGSALPGTVEKGILTFLQTDLTGLYTVEGPAFRRAFAVRLTDPEESNVDRSESQADSPRVDEAREATERADLSRPLLSIALPVLSVETWLLQRRLRGRRR